MLITWRSFVLAALIALPMHSHADVVEGFVPYDEALMSARFRSFGNTGGGEVFVGVGDLGVGANRQEINLTWTDGDYPFVFTLDRVNDELRVDVDGQMLVFPDLANQVATRTSGTYTYDDLNILQIDVAQRDAGSTVQIIGLTQNGELLGDFIPDSDGFFTWTSQGGCVVTPDTGTLSGTLRIAGPFGSSQELSRVQLTAGVRESDGLDCGVEPPPQPPEPELPATPVPVMGPAWLALLMGLIGLVGLRAFRS